MGKGNMIQNLMTDDRLIKTKKNEVLLAIQSYGFIPSDFNWVDEPMMVKDVGEVMRSKLLHPHTGYFCRFGRDFLTYSPGREIRVETERVFAWEVVKAAVGLWLQ